MEQQTEQTLVSLTELAQIFKLNKSTLSYYYLQGLLKPAYVRKDRGGIILFDKSYIIPQIESILKHRQKNKRLKRRVLLPTESI